MLKKIYIFLSAAFAVWSLFFLNGYYKLFAPLIFQGTFLLLFCLHFLYLLFSSLFLKKGTAKEYLSYPWFMVEETCLMVLSIFRVDLEVTGMEKIPDNGRFLFVCNHCSNIDPISAVSALRGKHVAFVCKDAIINIPACGPYLRSCGFTSIDRENPRNALKTIAECAEMIKSGEFSIGIYPEGTRSKDGVLLPFHDGVFKIAQKAGVPVVVASISGSDRLKHRFPLRRTKVKLSVLDVIPCDDFKRVGSHGVSARARELIEASLSSRDGV